MVNGLIHFYLNCNEKDKMHPKPLSWTAYKLYKNIPSWGSNFTSWHGSGTISLVYIDMQSEVVTTIPEDQQFSLPSGPDLWI